MGIQRLRLFARSLFGCLGIFKLQHIHLNGKCTIFQCVVYPPLGRMFCDIHNFLIPMLMARILLIYTEVRENLKKKRM